MKKETMEKIIEFFNENGEIFTACIEELDSYNGYLGDSRYYEMELLNEFYTGQEPLEILQRAYFGHDKDTYTTDGYGNRTYGEFNPNRDYFTFNGYGNFVSTDHIDHSEYLDEYVIESMCENRDYIDTIAAYDELNALFDELEEPENDN